MQKMTLATRLIGGFLIVASITLVVGFLGWKEISDSNESNTRAVFSENISKQLLQREIDHLNWAIKVGEFQRNEEMTELGVEKDDHKCNFGKWYYSEEREKAGTAVPEIKGLLDKLEEPHRKLHQSAVQLEEILKKGKEHRPEALSLFQKETISHLKSVQQLLGEIRARTEQHVTEARKISDIQSNRAGYVSLTGMIAGPVVALMLGIVLSFSISKLIRRVILGLKEGSTQVSSASGQVSLAGQQLADGTSEQAAAIEESSSSLEEMASMTRQNAEHARHANELMTKASRVTEKANHSMTEDIRSKRTSGSPVGPANREVFILKSEPVRDGIQEGVEFLEKTSKFRLTRLELFPRLAALGFQIQRLHGKREVHADFLKQSGFFFIERAALAGANP